MQALLKITEWVSICEKYQYSVKYLPGLFIAIGETEAIIISDTVLFLGLGPLSCVMSHMIPKVAYKSGKFYGVRDISAAFQRLKDMGQPVYQVQNIFIYNGEDGFLAMMGEEFVSTGRLLEVSNIRDLLIETIEYRICRNELARGILCDIIKENNMVVYNGVNIVATKGDQKIKTRNDGNYMKIILIGVPWSIEEKIIKLLIWPYWLICNMSRMAHFLNRLAENRLELVKDSIVGTTISVIRGGNKFMLCAGTPADYRRAYLLTN